jgi:hypothetical protein
MSALGFLRLVGGYWGRCECNESLSTSLRFAPCGLPRPWSGAFVSEATFFRSNVGCSFLQFDDRWLSSMAERVHGELESRIRLGRWKDGTANSAAGSTVRKPSAHLPNVNIVGRPSHRDHFPKSCPTLVQSCMAVTARAR